MKLLSGLLIAAVAALTSAADYVVTVAANTTNTVDAAFVAELGAAGRLVKRGAGVLKSSAAMASYAGEIVVEEGVLLVTETGAVGTTAGRTVVSNGASIVFSLPSANSAKFGNEKFFIAGRGAEGELGALVNAGAGLTGEGCIRYITLLDDAKIRATGELTIYAGMLDMNGHTLSISVRNKDNNGNTTWEFTMSFNRSRVVNPGHMILEDGRLSINSKTLSDGTAVWDGDNSNTLTLKNRARLRLANSLTKLPWKIIAEKGSGVMVAGNADATPQNNAFLGDIEVQDAIPFSYTSGQVGTMNLHGSVYGAGGMYWDGYTTLHLWNTNGFSGSMTVNGLSNYGTPIHLHCGRALPFSSQGIKLSNCDLPMSGDDRYELPVLNFTNASDKVISGAEVQGGTVAGLRKTGAGQLTINSRLAVTGKTELVQGSIKLMPSELAVVGLRQTWTNVVNDVKMNYWYDVGANTVWPSAAPHIRMSPHISYLGKQPFHSVDPAVVAYDGYIWNNSDEPKEWSFMSATASRSKLWINGSEVISQISYQYALFKKVVLRPGANKFRYAVCLFTTSTCGERVPETFFDFSGNEVKAPDPATVAWTDHMGFAINRNGADSMHYSDYEKAIDPGDGSLFTVTTNEAQMAAMRPAFSNFVCYAGTTLDLNERYGIVSIPEFSGEGTVANGILEIGKKLVVRADMAEPLKFVDAELRFAENAVVSADDETALSRERVFGNPYVIAVTDGAFTQTPATDPELAESRWKVELSKDSRSMLMYYVPRGLSVVVR